MLFVVCQHQAYSFYSITGIVKQSSGTGRDALIFPGKWALQTSEYKEAGTVFEGTIAVPAASDAYCTAEFLVSCYRLAITVFSRPARDEKSNKATPS